MAIAAGPVPPIASQQLLILLLQLGLLLLLAIVLGRLAARYKMPAVVGELCAGVLVGPSVLAHAAPRVSAWLLPHNPAQYHLLDAVGELGVLLLVAITGMQMDLGLVRRRGFVAAKIGTAGLIVPLGLGVGIGLALPATFLAVRGGRGAFALFLGVAMGVSALPVIARILMDLRMQHRDVGQLILCAVTVDDIAGWLLLAIVSAMATSEVHAASVGFLIAGLFITAAGAVLARPLIRVSLGTAGRSPGNGPTIAVVVCLVLLAAAATQALKLEAVIGAFLCGIIIKSCSTFDSAKLAPLNTTVMSVLAPIYFATAGLRMDLTALDKPTVLLVGIIVLAAAIAGKFAGAYAGARLSRLPHWEGMALGAGINSRGVVEVIVAMTGVQLGVLTQQMYTIIVLVAIVTSLMTPPLLRWTMARVEYTAEERLRSGIDEVPAVGGPSTDLVPDADRGL